MACTDNRNVIGAHFDLIELVRNDNNRLPGFLQVNQAAYEVVHLLRNEHGRRFIQDEQIDIAVEHFQDLHTLLCADGNIRNFVGNIQIKIKLVHKRLNFGFFLLFVNQDAAEGFFPDFMGAHRFCAENDILIDGQRRRELEVLVYHADAQLNGIARRSDGYLFAAEEDLALRRLQDAIEHIHEGGLTGAVFTDDGADLPFLHCQINVIVGSKVSKFLR